jgi:hypothetical protein
LKEAFGCEEKARTTEKKPQRNAEKQGQGYGALLFCAILLPHRECPQIRQQASTQTAADVVAEKRSTGVGIGSGDAGHLHGK